MSKNSPLWQHVVAFGYFGYDRFLYRKKQTTSFRNLRTIPTMINNHLSDEIFWRLMD